jgi:DNA-directed RNA polymerase subunit M/transcription elongation factor TFIIS
VDADNRKEARLMDQLVNPARCCPKCGSTEYTFRGRKTITAEAGQPATAETKYACKACGKEWKVRVPVKEAG